MYEGISKETMIREYFGCDIRDIADIVIISPILDLEKFKTYSHKLIKHFEGWYEGVTVEYKGKRISVISSGIGAPLTGDCVLALQYSDCKRILFSGSAGAINAEYEIGDMMAVGQAIIGEGFSRYHRGDITENCFGKDVYGDLEMADLMLNNISAYEDKYHIKTYSGKIFSIDSILGESKEAFDYMISKGCDAVEMEVSAVFTACSKIGRSAAALIFISDLPLKNKSLFEGRNEEDHELYKKQKREIPGILLDLAVQLSEN